MKLTLKLAQIVATVAGPNGGERQPFLESFRKLRQLGLPCAYELALCAGTIETHAAAYREAHVALVKRLGEEVIEGDQKFYRVKPEHVPEFMEEHEKLLAKPVELPVAAKLKLGRLDGQLSADDLIPLLDLVEP